MGDHVVVQCSVLKGDPPIHLSWLHDGVPAAMQPGIQVMPLSDFALMLLIERLRHHHQGNYTCQAQSPHATVHHSAYLKVHGESTI